MKEEDTDMSVIAATEVRESPKAEQSAADSRQQAAARTNKVLEFAGVLVGGSAGIAD
jgi:hypothetical protein